VLLSVSLTHCTHSLSLSLPLSHSLSLHLFCSHTHTHTLSLFLSLSPSLSLLLFPSLSFSLSFAHERMDTITTAWISCNLTLLFRSDASGVSTRYTYTYRYPSFCLCHSLLLSLSHSVCVCVDVCSCVCVLSDCDSQEMVFSEVPGYSCMVNAYTSGESPLPLPDLSTTTFNRTIAVHGVDVSLWDGMWEGVFFVGVSSSVYVCVCVCVCACTCVSLYRSLSLSLSLKLTSQAHTHRDRYDDSHIMISCLPSCIPPVFTCQVRTRTGVSSSTQKS
jgi:hypothetical protein